MFLDPEWPDLSEHRITYFLKHVVSLSHGKIAKPISMVFDGARIPKRSVMSIFTLITEITLNEYLPSL